MNYAVCYVSTAEQNLTKEEVNEVLEFSEKKNNAHDLTGILLYSEGNFFQVLEGEKQQVLKIFATIKEDNRHYDLLKIFEKPIEEPQFPKYVVDFLSVNMQYRRKELQPYLSQVENLNPQLHSSVKYILSQFLEGK